MVERFGNVEYFAVSTDGDSIVLRPLRESRTDEVRVRLASLGIQDEDVQNAMEWARKKA